MASKRNMKEVGMALNGGRHADPSHQQGNKRTQRIYCLPESVPPLTGDWATRSLDDEPEDREGQTHEL
jgi:hypothetical protein